MTSRVVTLIVAPVHRRDVRRSEALAAMSFGTRQCRDERANLIYLSQQILSVLQTSQIGEDRARHDPEPACFKRGSDPRHVERHVAVWTELQAAEARLRSLVQHALPVRQVRVEHVVHPPAAGCANYGDGEGHVGALPAPYRLIVAWSASMDDWMPASVDMVKSSISRLTQSL